MAHDPRNIFPPYCGVEMLPHAVGPDGTPWPIVCAEPQHPPWDNHKSDEPEVIWPWQDSVSND